VQLTTNTSGLYRLPKCGWFYCHLEIHIMRHWPLYENMTSTTKPEVHNAPLAIMRKHVVTIFSFRVSYLYYSCWQCKMWRGVITDGEETWWTPTPAHCREGHGSHEDISVDGLGCHSKPRDRSRIQNRCYWKTGTFLQPVNCLTAMRIVAAAVLFKEHHPLSRSTGVQKGQGLIACGWYFAVSLYFSVTVC